jgi:hypothetical protein
MRKLTIFAVALLAACDSDSDPTSKDIPASQINESIADAYCEILSECAADGDQGLFAVFVAAADRAACRAFFTRAVDEQFALIEARVQSGEITYDAATFARCMAEVKSSCALDELSGCDAAFEGKVALGGPCESDLDCAGDARCNITFSSGDTCPTTSCVARVARGAACDHNGDCSQSAGPTACTSASNSCVPLTYEPNLAEGARCDEAFNANGVTRRTCADGLACVYEETEGPDQAFCRRTLAEGSDCSESEIPCAGGLICLRAAGTEGETCQSLTVVRKVGGECSVDEDATPLMLCSLMDQLGCDNGKCRKWGDGTAGAYCDVLFETDFSCDRGLYCGPTSTCMSQKAAGADCEDSDECLDGYCDNSGEQTGVCVSSVCN